MEAFEFIIVIVIAVISVAANFAKKKEKRRQEEAKKATQTAALEGERTGGQSLPQRQPTTPDIRFPDFYEGLPKRSAKPDPRFPAYEPSKDTSEMEDGRFPSFVDQETEARRRARAAKEARERELAQKREALAREAANARIHAPAHTPNRADDLLATTVLQASVSSASMRENMISNDIDTPALPQAAPHSLFSNRNALTNGILMIEILGKPKALRGHR